MSFDLFIFNTDSAPKKGRKFLAWYDSQTDWKDGVDYNNPQKCSSNLQAWFAEMILVFPPLNGPLANREDDSEYVTDYGLGLDFIYACYYWQLNSEATALARKLALQNGLGIFFVSSTNGLVEFPDGTSLAIKKPWWRFW